MLNHVLQYMNIHGFIRKAKLLQILATNPVLEVSFRNVGKIMRWDIVSAFAGHLRARPLLPGEVS